jgi:hypothetical protein
VPSWGHWAFSTAKKKRTSSWRLLLLWPNIVDGLPDMSVALERNAESSLMMEEKLSFGFPFSID